MDGGEEQTSIDEGGEVIREVGEAEEAGDGLGNRAEGGGEGEGHGRGLRRGRVRGGLDEVHPRTLFYGERGV